MAKGKSRKRKNQPMSWCWYCDREFEDDRVLLLHQKAKHFKCSHCPRRLNTAGGLAVHIDQVHKLPTEKIENAIPGRDSFDVEIYGMEGIPRDDLAEWKKRKAAETGVEDITNRPKRTKIDLSVIAASDLAKALATHRALMSGQLAPSALVPPPINLPGSLPPPPGMPVPPPGMAMPMPPPGFPSMPPPGMPMPPPGFPFSAPPGMPAPPPGFPGLAPPGFPALPGLPGLPGGVPGIPGMPAPPVPIPQPTSDAPPTAASAPAIAQAMEKPQIRSSAVQLKPGQMLVYGDNEVSPEEKRAQQPQYAVSAVQGAESNSGGRARAEDRV